MYTIIILLSMLCYYRYLASGKKCPGAELIPALAI